MDAAESHMGENSASKKVQNVNKSILDVFSDLVVKAEIKRNETCLSLIQHLTKSVAEDSVSNQQCVATRVYFLCICFYFASEVNVSHSIYFSEVFKLIRHL